MMYSRSIRLIIDSKIDDIALLAKAIKGICSTVIHDEITLYNVELSLVEAVANVINHAYHRKSGNSIEVAVSVEDAHVTFQIMDTGDPAQLPVPKKELDYNSEDLTTFPESGMGLFLIYRIMDEVSYKANEGKNTLTMKKHLNKPKN